MCRLKMCVTSFAGKNGEGILRPLFGKVIEFDIAIDAFHDSRGTEFGEAGIKLSASEAERVGVVFVAESEDRIAHSVELGTASILIDSVPKGDRIIRHLSFAPSGGDEKDVLVSN